MKVYNHSEILGLEKYFRRNLMNTVSGFKSAHLIGTANEAGQSNLAVFNSVVHIGATPPYLGFILRPTTVERHTYNNIKSTGFYTLNAITEEIHAQAHQTSAKYPVDISEFDACELEAETVEGFSVPFVTASPIKMAMSYVEEYPIQANGTILVIGKVEKLILSDGIVEETGHIDFEKLDVVSINGLDTYFRTEKLGRYAFARPNQPTRRI